MFCPSTRIESAAPAYEVTYSFTGQPTASDEFTNRHFTLTVYFRAEELAPEVRQALSGGKPSRADLAGYFAVHTNRAPVQRVAIENARSTFCAGAHVDGAWTHSNQNCRDDIRYTMVTGQSDFVTVKINSLSKAEERAGVAGAIEESKASGSKR